MQNVLRLKQGEEIVLFDGAGTEATAEIVSIAKRSVELRILEKRSTQPESQRTIILGTAVPKGDRFRWLVEKATELGVTRLVPLITERSVVEPGSGKLEKMQQTVIAACKQCGRNRLMEIAPLQSLDEFLSAAGELCARLIAHPSGMSCPHVLDESMPPRAEPQSVVLAIGPEGGFTRAEIELAKSRGWHVVDLGPRILRVETAALALTSAIVHRLQALS